MNNPLNHDEMKALCVFDTPIERDAAKRYAAYAESKGCPMPVPISRQSPVWRHSQVEMVDRMAEAVWNLKANIFWKDIPEGWKSFYREQMSVALVAQSQKKGK